MRFEPGFIPNLRNEIANLNPEVLKHINIDRVVSLASQPHLDTFNFVEHIQSTDVVLCSPSQDVSQFTLIGSTKSLVAQPITCENIINFNCDCDNHRLIGDLGVRISPVGTLMPEPVHQSGSGILYDLAVKFSKQDDEFVILTTSELDSKKIINRMYSAFKEIGSDVVCLLQPKPPISTNSIPVWLNGRITVCDPRDLDEDFAFERAMYQEAGVYLLSQRVMRANVKWQYRARRYHRNKMIWNQFERDLSQLTHQFNTSYVVL